jgi:diadenosine tetraphosphate (Ap4A) HIT family hydrolase
MKRLDKTATLARLEAERGPGCRMCELVRDAEPIASSDHAVAVLDRYASRPGHVMIVLRRHEERIAALAWPEYAAMQRLAWEVCGALDTVLSPRRIYVAALGSAEPLDTSFPHLHVHVVPLADGGELDRPANVFTWVHGVYVFETDDEERALAATLRAAGQWKT